MEELDLSILRDADFGNPRHIDDASLEALKVSIGEWGDISGIVLDKTHGLVSGHQRVRALREQYGEGLALRRDNGTLRLHTPSGAAFDVREVDWPLATCIAANVAANSALISGAFTPHLGELLPQVQAALPELSIALRLPEIEVPTIPLAPVAPDDFAELDEDIETEHKCPKCGYEWSGTPA